MKNTFTLFIIALLTLLTACTRKTPADTAITIHGKYTYRGAVADGQPDGYGVLLSGDSAVYSGQWKAGKRHGRAPVTDPQGRTVQAVFPAGPGERGLLPRRLPP